MANQKKERALEKLDDILSGYDCCQQERHPSTVIDIVAGYVVEAVNSGATANDIRQIFSKYVPDTRRDDSH